MISGCPSLIQVTVVAGEPVEIQVMVDDMDSWVNLRFVMLGGAVRERAPYLILLTIKRIIYAPISIVSGLTAYTQWMYRWSD